jgi:hypothetical protein
MIREGNSIVWSPEIEAQMLKRIAEERNCQCNGSKDCPHCQLRLTEIVLSAK